MLGRREKSCEKWKTLRKYGVKIPKNTLGHLSEFPAVEPSPGSRKYSYLCFAFHPPEPGLQE